MLTTQEALVALATTSAAAAVQELRTLGVTEAGLGPVSVVLPGRDPLSPGDLPAAIASVTNATGGGTIFVLPMTVARRLAAAARGEDAPPLEDGLGDTELEALRDVAGRVREAAAAAVGAALGLEVEPGEVDVRVAQTGRDAKIGFQGTTRATLAALTLFGETCKLVQLVPADVIMRIAQDDGEARGDAAVRDALGATLRDVPLRVWAEVGRARLRSAEVASLSDGAIIELDRAADDPVDLYVNGSRIATGRLVCIDGKEWAVRLEEVFSSAEADPAAAA